MFFRFRRINDILRRTIERGLETGEPVERIMKGVGLRDAVIQGLDQVADDLNLFDA